MADVNFERAAVERLCHLLRLEVAPDSYRDPNSRKGATAAEVGVYPGEDDTGADVEILFDGRRVGVQVTEYHVDEAETLSKTSILGKDRKGSRLRQAEVNSAKVAQASPGAVKAYGFSASANYLPSLSCRVREKVGKAIARPNNLFDDLWLLVCAQISRWGATGSTMISPSVVNLQDLDAQIAPLLEGSPFSQAFLLIWLDGVVYGWMKGDKWRALAGLSVAVLDDQKRISRHPVQPR